MYPHSILCSGARAHLLSFLCCYLDRAIDRYIDDSELLLFVADAAENLLFDWLPGNRFPKYDILVALKMRPLVNLQPPPRRDNPFLFFYDCSSTQMSLADDNLTF